MNSNKTNKEMNNLNNALLGLGRDLYLQGQIDVLKSQLSNERALTKELFETNRLLKEKLEIQDTTATTTTTSQQTQTQDDYVSDSTTIKDLCGRQRDGRWVEYCPSDEAVDSDDLDSDFEEDDVSDTPPRPVLQIPSAHTHTQSHDLSRNTNDLDSDFEEKVADTPAKPYMGVGDAFEKVQLDQVLEATAPSSVMESSFPDISPRDLALQATDKELSNWELVWWEYHCPEKRNTVWNGALPSPTTHPNDSSLDIPEERELHQEMMRDARIEEAEMEAYDPKQSVEKAAVEESSPVEEPAVNLDEMFGNDSDDDTEDDELTPPEYNPRINLPLNNDKCLGRTAKGHQCTRNKKIGLFCNQHGLTKTRSVWKNKCQNKCCQPGAMGWWHCGRFDYHPDEAMGNEYDHKHHKKYGWYAGWS